MAINNEFISLEVPSTPATGVASDISGLISGLTLIVLAPESTTGGIVVEVSADGTNFAPALTVSPMNNPSAKFLDLAANFARIRRISGTGLAFAAVGGANVLSPNLFGALSVNAVDTSEMGAFKTIVVSGQYDKEIIIEGSVDGVNFASVAEFDTLASNVISIRGTFVSMRIREGSPLDGVNVGVYASVDGIYSVKSLAQQAMAFATGALARGVQRYAAFNTFAEVGSQPAGVKEASFEFNQGVPLHPDALFYVAQFRQTTTWENLGSSLIEASIGTFAEKEKYAAKTPINNPANEGETFTNVSTLFLLAPIGGDIPVVTYYSVDDLNTLTAGALATDLYYTTP